MMNEKRAIQKYIDEKKELHNLVLQIINESKVDDDTLFQKLIVFLDTHQYEKNKPELEHFLHLISNLAANHHRGPNFFKKIEKILTFTSKFYNQFFSNVELFTIFQQSKPIILFLLKSKMILIDPKIFRKLTNFQECIDDEFNYPLYPEFDSITKSGTIENNSEENSILKLKEDIENFEINYQKFENESNLCSIIRKDLIEDFIIYVNKTNISLSSQIKRSIFETNSIFIEKPPTLIEYAAFFGSIQIMNYLESNDVKLTPSIWLYAVHSNNAEVIYFLEEKQIEMDDRTFSEAVKCHHNNIAHYIIDNHMGASFNITDLIDNDVSIIVSSSNYEFFPYEIDGNKFFYYLCKSGYYELINLYLSLKKEEIAKYAYGKIKFDIKSLIQQALEENKLDVAFDFISRLDSIPKKYFENLEITKIVIPNTIKLIDEYAFDGCASLTEIIIPSSVTKIEHSAFSALTSLTEITIPSSVTYIGSYVFSECYELTRITFEFPSSVGCIGNYAFDRCTSLTKITIPSSVYSIGDYAFNDCASLTQIIFETPSNLTEIGYHTCSGLSSLEQITIPSSVTEIGNGAFSECFSLEQVTFEFPSSVDNIGNYAFDRCFSLTKITIPSSVTGIGDCAFYECSSLKQITFPSSVHEMGYYVFQKCSSLKQIEFETPSSLNEIGEDTFSECTSLEQITIPSSVSYIGSKAFAGCSSLTKVIILSSVTEIVNSAFDGCSSLKEIAIPSSLYQNNQFRLKIPPKVIITTF